MRLPTEDEWEYSVRGASGRVFPWGDDSKASESSLPQEITASAVGVAENGSGRALLGNVAEWTESHTERQHVLRGGSWLLPQAYFQRLALRRLALHAILDGSFRCAMSTESWPEAQQ